MTKKTLQNLIYAAQNDLVNASKDPLNKTCYLYE
jgi:hypothetical protein